MVVHFSPEVPSTASSRRSTLVVDESALLSEFREFLETDGGIIKEAIEAADEMRRTPHDALDNRLGDATGKFGSPKCEGYVSRRAPMNPFSSPKLGRFQSMKGPEKVSDPALENNPLRGKLIATLFVNFVLFFVFAQSLIYNRIIYGKFYAAHADNSMVGPEPQTLYDLGGLHTTRVREGEVVRLFWAMWMHSGWIHILFNLLCQLQYMYMFEPDWGFWRTLFLFGVSGLSGNLLTAICDPCSITVGSSGGLFGLMGAMVVYCIEFWATIPRPLWIIIFSIVVILASLLMGFSGTTANWAHMGGLVGGILFSFGTVTQLSICKRRKPKDDKVLKLKKTGVSHKMMENFASSCSCSKFEWAIRIPCWIALIILWVVCFYFLLINTEYNPPGHVTFKGVTSCCCCTPSGFTVTQCAQCDYRPQGDETFGEICEAVKAGRSVVSKATKSSVAVGKSLDEIFDDEDWEKIKKLSKIISFDETKVRQI